VVVFRSFPDHYNYTDNAAVFFGLLKELKQTYSISGLITTYKDFIKIKTLGDEFYQWASYNNFIFCVLDLELSLNAKDKKTTLEMIKSLTL